MRDHDDECGGPVMDPSFAKEVGPVTSVAVAGPTVTASRFTVSRIPDDSSAHAVWSIDVESAGHGRWAVRNCGRCLLRSGEWEREPIPSSRTEEWLATARWGNPSAAIMAALAAEANLIWNGQTPADVLARIEPRTLSTAKRPGDGPVVRRGQPRYDDGRP